MGLRSLIQLAAILIVSSGKLPTILRSVRVAQLYILKDSQASKWGKAMLLTSPKYP
jgi:hypothetical protein